MSTQLEFPDAVNRLSQTSDHSGSMAQLHAFSGIDSVAQRSQALGSAPHTDLNYFIPGGNPDGGDQYTGLDRFGRIVEQQWLNTATGTASDDFQYTYDRDGNVLSRTDALDSSLNEQYSYDGLNRLISFTRGTETQSWNLDAAGNWSSFTNSGTTQNRSSNLQQNQITAISGATTPTYDNNGNTLTDDLGTVYTFDAWDRMVKAVTTGGSTEVDSYDALGRRITTTLNGVPTHFYYSSSGQVLEEIEYLTGGQSVIQNIWSLAYVDALFARIINGTAYTVQQDANWNVTAVAKSVFSFQTGQYNLQVQERFVYDPYGQPTAAPFLNMPYLFQGGRYDTTTGLYQFGARNYSPTLGRWMEQDPEGYGAGDNNFYGFLGENPANATDPSGLEANEQVILTWQGKPPGAFPFPLSPTLGSQGGVPIGEPGFWESFIPIWGPGRSALNAFQQGNWGWGLFYTGLAASDAFFVGTLITASSELAVKGGLKVCGEEFINFLKDESGALRGPIKTPWGWTGSNSWNAAVRVVASGGPGGVIRTIGGHVPTYEEAVLLIEQAGGTIVRVEGPHAAGGVAGHINFNHINYTTASGLRSHLAIQALPPAP